MFSHDLPLPTLPPRAQWAPPPPAPYPPGRVPSVPDQASFSAVERSRLSVDAASAAELDRQLHQVTDCVRVP